MLTQKPALTTVRIKVQEFKGGEYQRSSSITVYDTTEPEVTAVIEKALNGRAK